MKSALKKAFSDHKEGGARMTQEFSEQLKTYEKSSRENLLRYIYAAVKEGAGVSDIARWIGVSRGTVYRLISIQQEEEEQR